MAASSTIVWDLETVPDLDAAARMLHMEDAPADEVRQALGDGFPIVALALVVGAASPVAGEGLTDEAPPPLWPKRTVNPWETLVIPWGSVPDIEVPPRRKPHPKPTPSDMVPIINIGFTDFLLRSPKTLEL